MNQNVRNYFRFLRFFAPYWLIIVFVLCLLLAVTFIKFVIPLVLMYLIDQFGKSADQRQFLMILVGIAVVVVAAYFFRLLLQYLLNVIKEKIFLKAQLRLFLHIQRLPVSFFQANQPGYLISRIRSDIYAAQGLLADRFITLVMSVMTLALGVGLCLWINVELTVVSVLFLPVFALAAILPNKRLRQMSGTIQEKNARVLESLEESLVTVIQTKLFRRERWQGLRLIRALAEEIRAKIRLVIFGSSVGQLAELITNLSILVALGYGAMKIAAGVITVGELVAFLSFYGYLFSSVGNFITLNVEVQGALGSVERVFALMDLPPEGEPAAPAIRTAPPRRLECDRLSFEQVTFRYGDEGFQLQDISFEVCRGESYALVGRTGSGKSTLASLIPRFFEPQEGAIRLGGTDLRHIELGALRDRIAFLTHTPTIFSGTIRDNITFGRRWIDPPAVETVARMAEIHEFIQSLPGGYEAELGERGLKLSLGQAQRIALARALLKAPEIVIFDEATSGLDSACERTIMERLAVLFRNCIVLNISHRLFSVQNATRILLLEDGRLVDAGSHEDLITTSPVYRELCKRQLIKSERQTLVTPLG